MYLFSQIFHSRRDVACNVFTGFGTIFAERERERERESYIISRAKFNHNFLNLKTCRNIFSNKCCGFFISIYQNSLNVEPQTFNIEPQIVIKNEKPHLAGGNTQLLIKRTKQKNTGKQPKKGNVGAKKISLLPSSAFNQINSLIFFKKLRPTQIRDFKMLQTSNSSRVMDAGDHFKNGASQKSQMSRGNHIKRR